MAYGDLEAGVGRELGEVDFPGADPVSYLEALNRLIDQDDGAKDDPLLKPPVDIRDVPDKPTDAWVDRTIHMVCGTCMNYQEKGRDHRGKLIGACKNNSPTMKGYPRVFDDEQGCGAHKLRVFPK